MVLKEVVFQRKVKIQNLNRIALNPQLLENIGLTIWDEVSIFLDVSKNQIIVRGEK